MCVQRGEVSSGLLVEKFTEANRLGGWGYQHCSAFKKADTEVCFVPNTSWSKERDLCTLCALQAALLPKTANALS
jgi:hypothetical protein